MSDSTQDEFFQLEVYTRFIVHTQGGLAHVRLKAVNTIAPESSLNDLDPYAQDAPVRIVVVDGHKYYATAESATELAKKMGLE